MLLSRLFKLATKKVGSRGGKYVCLLHQQAEVIVQMSGDLLSPLVGDFHGHSPETSSLGCSLRISVCRECAGLLLVEYVGQRAESVKKERLDPAQVVVHFFSLF